MFVSMDVVFREHEPFYGEPTDLTNDSRPSSYSGNISSQYDDLDVLIVHRKQPWSEAGKLPSKLDPYNVSSYVSYDTVGPSYKSFMAALDYAVPLCRIESMSKGVIRLLDQIKI